LHHDGEQESASMTWVDALGYLAASLVLATFCMKTMLLLRGVAICSNLAFLVYAMAQGIYPSSSFTAFCCR
jgi:CRP/FNR family transcriptional regulator, cyclic AMP receptor protein